jgi:uncharacterized protein YqiB (DUF1249 family)
MTELEVLRLLLARRDNYGISELTHTSGRSYSLIMNGRSYTAIIIVNSFDFYQLRYHMAKQIPDLVICFTHDTVLAVSCLSLKSGRLADPYDLPQGITDVKAQRHRSKAGSQCLLGMYLCGMRSAQDMISKFRPTTRKRYLERARELSKRRPGRPVTV